VLGRLPSAPGGWGALPALILRDRAALFEKDEKKRRETGREEGEEEDHEEIVGGDGEGLGEVSGPVADRGRPRVRPQVRDAALPRDGDLLSQLRLAGRTAPGKK
jgi:hypothetical protein